METRKEKQRFLFEEILSKKFNIRMFERFLKFKKEDGDDIDLWQKDELISEVQEFKQLFKHSVDFQKIIEHTRTSYSKSTSNLSLRTILLA